MPSQNSTAQNQAGFSLLELLISTAIIIVVLSLASTLLVGSFGIRRREDNKSDAVADTMQALNVMSREIANAGYTLPAGIGLPANGIVAASSGATSIRVVTNPNENNTVRDADEDVMYTLYNDTTTNPAQRYIVRYNINAAANQTSVLANRVDSLTFRYYDQRVSYDTTPGVCDISNVTTKTLDALGNVVSTPAVESTDRTRSKYVVIAVCVTLPQIGTPGAPDYKPPWQVQLTSDVVLRNKSLANF
ncbi:MAG TPA: prepilin-type N-terminal cleavage/methylation domain-containing protein [Pyrinomonadaceae bacterium]|jgi:type II secretory pathway pseudopilin PulG